MDAPGSITRCIRDLENGARRDEAAREIWDRFFEDLTRYALKQLKAMHAARGVADQEDAAARAFAKVCRGIESGRLKLGDREDLRKLLLWSTKGETIKQRNRLTSP
jgi:hypothetical protein